MHALELKIPPPAITVLVAAAMWGISMITPPLAVPSVFRLAAAIAIALVGFGIGVAGIISFRRAKTTINPLKPETTSALVRAGIYRFSRNPMYLGILFALVAWSVFLSSAWTLAGPVIFVLYMNQFQISPEERVLLTMFGDDYSAYKIEVRRWL